MHSSIEPSTPSHAIPSQTAPVGINPLEPSQSYTEYRIIRRNGAVVSFEPSKIAIAVTKALDRKSVV